MQVIKRVGQAIKRTKVGDLGVRRFTLWYLPARRLFDRLCAAPLEERRIVSQRLLERVLRSAMRTAYGRQHGGGLCIEEWPFLEKDQVRQNPTAFLSSPVWLTVPASTSGTSGLPLKLYRSLPSICVEQAAIDRLLLTKGVHPVKMRVAVLRSEYIKSPNDMRPPFWRFEAGGRRMVLSSNHLTTQTIGDFYEALRDFSPDCLMTYPSVLEPLCCLLLKTSRSLSIPLVVCSSEVLTDSTRRLAQEVLGAEVIDYYGQAERVAFAYSFTPKEYYFLPGYAYIELVPYEVQEDGMLYEIVGTTLWNRAMPLVRYRTGDYIKLPHGLTPQQIEAICLGVMSFEGILGRKDDVWLLAPDGRRLTAIDDIPRDVEHVVRMQFIQERLDYIRILVLPAPGFSDIDKEQILRNAYQKLPESMQISIEVVDELVRTAQMKTPFVIRRIGG